MPPHSVLRQPEDQPEHAQPHDGAEGCPTRMGRHDEREALLPFRLRTRAAHQTDKGSSSDRTDKPPSPICPRYQPAMHPLALACHSHSAFAQQPIVDTDAKTATSAHMLKSMADPTAGCRHVSTQNKNGGRRESDRRCVRCVECA